MKRIILISFFVLFRSLSTIAQQPAFFMFGEKQFEGVDIYDVIQDNEFNYWFATSQGIYKHDGYSFEKIECEAMKASSVFNFVANNEGTIFCHNLNQQVFEIRGSKCRLFFEIPDQAADIHLLISSKDELIISSTRVYILNKKGVLINSSNPSTLEYLGGPFLLKNGAVLNQKLGQESVLIYENSKFTLSKFSMPKSTDGFTLSTLHFFRIKESSFGIDIKSKKLYSFDEESLTFSLVNQLDSYPINSPLRYYTVNNRLWVASNTSGIELINTNLNEKITQNKIFSDYFISDVYLDLEGNILLSTFDKGVIIIPDMNMPDVINLLKPYPIKRLTSDHSNTLFFGTSEGQLLSFSKNKIKEHTPDGTKSIETLYKWLDHPLVLFDNDGLTIQNTTTHKTTKLSIGSLKDVVRLSPDTIMVALNVGVQILTYNPTNQQFTSEVVPELMSRIYALELEKKTNYIYIATSEGLKFMNASGEVKDVKIEGNVVFVTDLVRGSNEVFAASRKNGILCLSKGKITRHFYPKHEEEVLSIFKFQIHKNKIYANTQIGLVVMDFQGNILTYLNKSSGLSINKIIDFHIHKDYLWIAHLRGVQKIKLSSMNKRIEAPTLYLSKIFVNNKPIKRKTLNNSFNWDEKKFRFVLSVPTLKNRENIRYHYQLEGNDNHWSINPYENNQVTYNSLGSGKYRFVVKAENNGVFSAPIYFSFRISPPFYLRWWFNTGLAFAGLLIVILFYRRKLRLQRKKAAQLNELNASKLTAIQSQMNPHFIFNSLNSIQDLVLKGDIDNSYTFITKFSNLVRRTLNYSDKDFIEFEQEIKLIELYLSLEKLRFKENLEYSIEVNDITDIYIPPMLIQPFIENALVHGLLHKEGLKKLTIRFKLEKHLICEIIDNGVGRKKSKEIKERQRAQHESFSIEAIKRRVDILGEYHGNDLGFHYEDLESEGIALGTKVTLKIPVRRKF